MRGRRRRGNGLPEGTLPDGRKPKLRWLRTASGRPALDELVAIDARIERAGGELVPMFDRFVEVHDPALVRDLERNGLVSTLDEGGLVDKLGITPAGDRALERYA